MRFARSLSLFLITTCTAPVSSCGISICPLCCEVARLHINRIVVAILAVTDINSFLFFRLVLLGIQAQLRLSTFINILEVGPHLQHTRQWNELKQLVILCA